MKKLPRARTNDIVVQSLNTEILIYDLNVHKAYNLNETSAAVYQACDGVTTFEELKRKHKFTDDLIFLALDQLQEDNLIEADAFLASPFKRMSRREAIRKVGLASLVALPVISSLVAPTAAHAGSACAAQGAAVCMTDADCESDSNCMSWNGPICVCTAGCCVPCPADFTNCNGVCVNTATDVNNCGSCGNVCGAGQLCDETFRCIDPL